VPAEEGPDKGTRIHLDEPEITKIDSWNLERFASRDLAVESSKRVLLLVWRQVLRSLSL
jgi:hypothetical protein